MYVKKGHHPRADDGPWSVVSGLTSSADPLASNDDKGNDDPNTHTDRQDNVAAGQREVRHQRSTITAAGEDPVKLIVFLML